METPPLLVDNHGAEQDMDTATISKSDLVTLDPSSSQGTSAQDPPKGLGVVTLEPYVIGSASSGAGALPKRKFEGSAKRNYIASRKFPNEDYEILPGLVIPNTYDKYLTLTMENSPESIFKVHRDIVKCCGRKPKISAQNNGHLLVEVNSPEESEKLKNVSFLGGVAVRCQPHFNLNTSKGLIYAPQLITYSEETLQKEFEDQGVIGVQRMKKKINGAITPQPGLILTFNSVRLPSSIEAAWYTYKIRQYIPRPRRCFHCQEFGHTTSSCRSKAQGRPAICVICSNEEHGECNKDPKCYHCGGSHPASSPNCDIYLFEKEVQATRVKERISFAEAKQKIRTMFIRPGLSYAKMLTESVAYKNNRSSKVTRQQVTNMRRQPVKRTLSRESSEECIQTAQVSAVSPLSKRRGRDDLSLASEEASVCISTVEVEVHAPMEAGSAVPGDPVSVKDVPVSGTSASLEAPVAVADTATDLESGIPRAEGATCISSSSMKADNQASIQAAPVKYQPTSTSEVTPPKRGTNSTIRIPASERKKREILASNKGQRLNKSSVTPSEGSLKSDKDKRKLKLRKSTPS